MDLDIIGTQMKVAFMAENICWVPLLLWPSRLLAVTCQPGFKQPHFWGYTVQYLDKILQKLWFSYECKFQFSSLNRRITRTVCPSLCRPCGCVYREGDLFMLYPLTEELTASPEKCALKPCLNLRKGQAVALAFCWDLQNWTRRNASANEVGFQASKCFFKKGTVCMPLQTCVRVCFSKSLCHRFWNK